MLTKHSLAALLPILCNAGLASAHGLFLQYDVHPPDRITVSAFWHVDEPAVDTPVRMLDPEGELVAAGTTNAQGQYTFTAPAPRAYRFEVVAAGHRADCQLTPEAVTLLGATDAPGTDFLPPLTAARDDHAHHDEEGAGHRHADEHDLDADPSAPSRPPAAHGGQAEPRLGSGLVSGLALILAGAAFLMTLSLRREVQLLKHRAGGQGS
ncbi:MAG: hypothetical protein JSU68_13085 [Phycisphaerales bacterium]|nr:MAG: hypothetical protein JSU68_13085 [Phycisphaerales bacterium]